MLRDDSSEAATQVVWGTDGAALLRLREGYSMTGPPSRSTFNFDSECQERMTDILRQFEGTHNFHNFTPSACPEQMSTQRCASVLNGSASGAAAVLVLLLGVD